MRAEVSSESETDATAEQPAPVAEGEVDVAELVTPVVISVQSTDEANGEAAATATPLLEPTEDGILPEQTDQGGGHAVQRHRDRS